MRSFAEQLGAMFVKSDAQTVVRRLRHIYSASAIHGYLAKVYIQYGDGRLEFINEVFVSMNDTNVRRREVGKSTWEERIPSVPGWFRCDPPTEDESK